MKRMLLLPLALLATIVVAAAAGAAISTIQITKNGFTPSSTTITVGDTVTWHNADAANHQVVANDGSFASPSLKPGDTYSFTFQKNGKLTYHDANATSHKGTVTVNGAPASVTLSTESTTITYGNNTSVSGAVNNQLANEPVTLTSQPFGKGSQSIDSTTTQTNGTFTFGVSPTIQTAYVAHWRTANSPPVTVTVAPRVGFGLSGGLYTAKVTSDLTYGGRFVWAQRRTSYGGWRNLKQVYLGANSRAVFHLRLAHGRSVLRLVLPSGQAGAGYVQGISRMISVRP